MGKPHWYRDHPGVVVCVPCDGALHRVAWRAGRLVVGHEDVAAELGLAAIGGWPPPCIRVLQAWRQLQHGFDLGLLQDLGQGSEGPTRLVTSSTLSHASPYEVLPAALRRRAAAAMVVRAQRRWGGAGLPEGAKQRFEDCLALNVSEAVHRSLAPLQPYRPHVDVAVSCAVAGSGEAPSARFLLSGQRGQLHCRVPLSWLVDVWAEGISVVDDSVVFDAQGAKRRGWLRVTVLKWTLRGIYGIRPLWSSGWACRDRRGRWILLSC